MTTVNFDQPSKGIVSSNDAGLSVTNNGGEAIHAETNATNGSAIVGVNQTGGGIYGESRGAGAGTTGICDGAGPGLFGESKGSGPGLSAKGRIAGHFEGDVEVTGDVRLLGADCAEEFDISYTESVEPGTVMVLDNLGNLEQSQYAYDKKVAGII